MQRVYKRLEPVHLWIYSFFRGSFSVFGSSFLCMPATLNVTSVTWIRNFSLTLWSRNATFDQLSRKTYVSSHLLQLRFETGPIWKKTLQLRSFDLFLQRLRWLSGCRRSLGFLSVAIGYAFSLHPVIPHALHLRSLIRHPWHKHCVLTATYRSFTIMFSNNGQYRLRCHQLAEIDCFPLASFLLGWKLHCSLMSLWILLWYCVCHLCALLWRLKTLHLRLKFFLKALFKKNQIRSIFLAIICIKPPFLYDILVQLLVRET